MRTLHLTCLLVLPACIAPWAGPPSDDLDKSWMEDIAANHVPTGDGSEFAGAPVEDPTGIEGLYQLSYDDGACIVRYDMEGTRTECSGCDYAFDVNFELSLDDCSMGVATSSSRLEFRRDRLYVDGMYVAAFTVDGPHVDWYGSGSYGGYDYYGYYYDEYYGGSSAVYYGRALLLR